MKNVKYLCKINKSGWMRNILGKRKAFVNSKKFLEKIDMVWKI